MKNKVNQVEPFSRYVFDGGTISSCGQEDGHGVGRGSDDFRLNKDSIYDCDADGVGRGNGGTGRYGWCNFWGNGTG